MQTNSCLHDICDESYCFFETPVDANNLTIKEMEKNTRRYYEEIEGPEGWNESKIRHVRNPEIYITDPIKLFFEGKANIAPYARIRKVPEKVSPRPKTTSWR